MENLKLAKGLVELHPGEMEVISGGNGIAFRFGEAVHKAFCIVSDWAKDYEGDPFIRRKMGGL